MSNVINIVGTVTDDAGATGNFSVSVTMDLVDATATVVPQIAPAGTKRTLTVTPNGGVPPYTYGAPVAPGITFTPVSGQPNVWTFTY